MRLFKLVAATVLALLAVPAVSRPTPASDTPIAVATAPAASVQQTTRADVDAWLDGYMPYALKRGDVAGAVVVVVKDGKVLTQRGFGYSDVDKRKVVDPDATLFRPGSISKLFTWTAVMQLVEQRKLDLDADVNIYLDFKIPARNGKPITLRNIMTHTPGFEEAIKGLSTDRLEKLVPVDVFLKRWTPERIFPPGTTPAYSNYGATLAGYIVERVSGMSFDDYLDRHIFGPLQMTRSSFRQPLPANLQPLISKGYREGSGAPKPYELIAHAPAGSLAATGADMAKFMIAHLNQGGALLKPETARMMHDTKLSILPPLNRMALGFYEQNINGRSVIAHGGDTQWFHSYLWLFPDDNVGLYVSVNSAGRAGAAGALVGGLLDEFADRYFPASGRDERVISSLASEHARMMRGTYLSSRRSESGFSKMINLVSQLTIDLDEKGGILFDGDERNWVEISPFVWRDLNSHDRLAAQVVDGEVVRVSFDAVSPFMVFDRTPWYSSAAWLLPALLASLAVLALTAVAWPTATIMRRRYGVTRTRTGQDLWARRLVSGFAAVVVLVIAGWAVALAAMASNLDNLDGRYDPLVWLLQLTGVSAFSGLMGAALWNAWRVWAGHRGWLSRGWSVILVLAAFVILWTALAFNLISFGSQI